MNASTLAIVLCAALLHASWNAMLKVSTDKVSMLGLIALGHVILGSALAFVAPFPTIESWPFLIGSSFIHYAYYALLARSYRLGDLSQVYPIARGIVPVLVTLGAQFAIGETLPFQAWIGVLTISAGVMLLSAGAFSKTSNPKAIGAAVATGMTIAAYSIVDGLGVRLAETALSYIAWLFILEVFVVVFVVIKRKQHFTRMNNRTLLLGILGGLVSALAYGLVIYAKEFSPLGIVSALRETSVLFAALIGVVLLGERPWRSRLLAVVIVVFGVLFIALPGYF